MSEFLYPNLKTIIKKAVIHVPGDTELFRSRPAGFFQQQGWATGIYNRAHEAAAATDQRAAQALVCGVGNARTHQLLLDPLQEAVDRNRLPLALVSGLPETEALKLIKPCEEAPYVYLPKDSMYRWPNLMEGWLGEINEYLAATA